MLRVENSSTYHCFNKAPFPTRLIQYLSCSKKGNSEDGKINQILLGEHGIKFGGYAWQDLFPVKLGG